MDRVINTWARRAVCFITVVAIILAVLAMSFNFLNSVAMNTNELSPETASYWAVVVLMVLTSLLIGIFCLMRWEKLLAGRAPSNEGD